MRPYGLAWAFPGWRPHDQSWPYCALLQDRSTGRFCKPSTFRCGYQNGNFQLNVSGRCRGDFFCGDAQIPCGSYKSERMTCDCLGNFQSIDYRNLRCSGRPADGVQRLPKPLQWKLVLVAVVRDEFDYLPDWVLYHRALGVHAFVLVSNQCSNASHQRLLDTVDGPKQRGVLVEVMPSFRCAKKFQTAAYRAAIRHLSLRQQQHRLSLVAHRTRVGFIDIDEFLVIGSQPNSFSSRTLSDQLFQPGMGCATRNGNCVAPQACQAAPMWTVGSVVFGTSFVALAPPTGPVPANFLLAAQDTCDRNCTGPDIVALSQRSMHKSFCILSELIARPNQTFPLGLGSWVHECLPTALGVALPGADARLNHYFTKSRSEYRKKRWRGRADKPKSWYADLRNESLWSARVDLRLVEQLALRYQHSSGREEKMLLHSLMQSLRNRSALPERAAAMLSAHCIATKSVACTWLGVGHAES